MSGVLTPKDITKAMLAMRDEKPRAPYYIGPKWAKDHLVEHEMGQPGCDKCARAWASMVRS